MWRYLGTRLLIMLPTLFGAVTLTFIVTQFVPGGPLDQILLELQQDGTVNNEAAGGGSSGYTARRSIDPAQVEQLNKLYGFDKPVMERYWDTLRHFAHMDLGQSYFRQESVWELIRSKLPVSLSLGLWTLFLTYLVSVPLGVAKAIRSGSRFDVATSVLVLTGYAIPGFVLGIVLLVLFGGGTFWTVFPLRGLTSDNFATLSPFAKVLDYLWHIVLPVTASVVSQFAIKTMLTRNSFLDEIHKQYVLTARAKGLSERRVLWKHVFRNALIPLVTGLPAAFIAAFFTNSLLIETLFSLDGLGLLSFESVKRRDYAVVLGALYLFTLIGLLAKLVGDLCYMLADPRIKLQGGAAR
ncbi:MAG: ABC transporter permease subunit [Gammaproteobacteria bacterium]